MTDTDFNPSSDSDDGHDAGRARLVEGTVRAWAGHCHDDGFRPEAEPVDLAVGGARPLHPNVRLHVAYRADLSPLDLARAQLALSRALSQLS